MAPRMSQLLTVPGSSFTSNYAFGGIITPKALEKEKINESLKESDSSDISSTSPIIEL